MIKPLTFDKCSAPHEYIGSHTEIAAYRNGVYMGRMRRCGITCPGYPSRPTYRLYYIDKPQSDIAVYDGGHFWPVSEWHAYYRENNATPPLGLDEGRG